MNTPSRNAGGAASTISARWSSVTAAASLHSAATMRSKRYRRMAGCNVITRCDRELDNLIAACKRAIARRDGEIAVACYRAAWEVLSMQGPFGVALALGDEFSPSTASKSGWPSGRA